MTIIGDLKSKASALLWPIHCILYSPPPSLNTLNIKQLYLLCPLHNCHRHLEPYVPVWCTPWKSRECQNRVYTVSLNSPRKSSMTCCCTPASSRDRNLPRMLGKEPTEDTQWLHCSLLEPVTLTMLLTSLLNPTDLGQFFIVIYSQFSDESQMTEVRYSQLYPSAPT